MSGCWWQWRWGGGNGRGCPSYRLEPKETMPHSSVCQVKSALKTFFYFSPCTYIVLCWPLSITLCHSTFKALLMSTLTSQSVEPNLKSHTSSNLFVFQYYFCILSLFLCRLKPVIVAQNRHTVEWCITAAIVQENTGWQGSRSRAVSGHGR